jgi:Flp pilus assembly protein TadG
LLAAVQGTPETLAAASRRRAYPWRLFVVLRRVPAGGRHRARSAGQAYVELVFVLPILALLALAVGDFGRVYATGIAVESAAREAADYAAFDDIVDSHFFQTTPADPVDAKDSIRKEALRRACAAVNSLPGYDAIAATCADATAMCTATAGGFCQLVVEDTRGNEPWVSTCGTDPQTDFTCGWTVHVTISFDFDTAIDLAPLPTTVHFVRESRYAISALPAGA